MTARTKIRIGALLAGIIAASLVLLPLRWRDEPVTPTAATADAAPPLPPPPPCIREHCFERPRYLRCTAYAGGSGPCSLFEINYEAHCDCVEWGVRPGDGGAE